MPAPLPPRLDGPLYPVTQQVYVDNLVPGVDVSVYQNGSLVGTGTASTTPGGMWVTLSKPLTQKDAVTAKQTLPPTAPPVTGVTAGAASDASPPVPVLPLPNPLPSPVFSGAISTCTTALLMNGLTPGCTLEITAGGPALVTARPNATYQWFDLDPTAVLSENEQLWAQLSASGHPPSSLVPSIPVIAALPLTEPEVANPPLLDCQTAISLKNTTPGALIKIINNGVTTVNGTPWDTASFSVPPLTSGGTSTAEQYYTGNCQFQDKTGKAVPLTILKGAPPLPEVTYGLCTDVMQLTVTNLVPGELLTVSRVVKGQAPTVVGVQGVSCSTATVILPSSFQSTDPDGPVSLELAVTLCGTPSKPPSTDVAYPTSPGGSYPKPTVRPPLYDCALAVQVLGAHPGSLLEVWSATSGLPRSAPVVATRSDPVIPLWSQLVALEEIYVTVKGCNAESPSPNQKVDSVPSPFGYPNIEMPVVAGSPDVTATGVYQGAQVYLYVASGGPGVLRSYVDTNDLATFDAPVVLPSGTPALVAGDLLQVIQVLCGQSNPLGQVGQGQVSVVPAAPSIHGGPHSDHNYIFADPTAGSGGASCNNLLGVEVTIVVTDDIISSDGFAFQLNTYGPKGAPAQIQQYGFKAPTAELEAFGETFSIPPSSIVNQEHNMKPLPGMVLHAGSTLTIALTYDGDNVTGAVFTVGGGGSTSPWTLVLTDVGESASDLSPIVAFQVNLVGPQGGLSTTFTSGAGNITYRATTSLTALSAPPSCCANTGYTQETGNSVYGLLPAASGTSFKQTFSVTQYL
jgi:hypothetical protein